MIKLTLFIVAALTAIVFTGEGKAASSGSWCLRAVTDDYSVDRCDYPTFRACQRERIRESNRSSCVRNPGLFRRG